jgi:hypothetical protein
MITFSPDPKMDRIIRGAWLANKRGRCSYIQFCAAMCIYSGIAESILYHVPLGASCWLAIALWRALRP